ncbi:hypothetical protein [Paenibacillus favisporus]|uniref:hypothetical protein n=1 Tax=Paenibacillus favisporus TaxID=221028 RepID=UPI003D2874DE
MIMLVLFACVFFFIVLALVASIPEIQMYLWVKRNLNEPLKAFCKSEPTSGSTAYLSKESYMHLNYYKLLDKESIEDLIFEIKFKLNKCQNGKLLINYLTQNCLPLVSLLIAGFALLANKVADDQLLSVFGFTLIIFIVIIIFALIDFSSKMLVQAPMNTHLLSLEKALEIINIDPKPRGNRERKGPLSNRRKRLTHRR